MSFKLIKEQINMFKGYINSIEFSLENIEINYKNNNLIRKRCLENGYVIDTFFLHCNIMRNEIRKLLVIIT